ncbi:MULTISPECIES: cellulose synthase subunit BcsC-related outer membrane protein [Pseudomonas]|uniref:cellulose synthase subunit BcsC-related outer membrane protein n=1 Tax=Pseudomonas TaxID=286 RepID=UPI001BEA939E|nr:MULTISPECIES: cellulose synthase subunit BcsC-related outer membrane protein [Pseudomonas]MBT2338471.1 BCSC C-terminal domain-containing protein [Pseudomonas fluorescens]MCD4531174.1 BCSC C-terminal domain-containing protein [Pseudomonas sp. C3-2018]
MRARRSTLAVAVFIALIAPGAHAEGTDIQAQLVEQGQYWQARSNASRSAEIWQKVLRLDPNQVDALYGMGLIGVKQNKPQQAQDYLVRLQALSPQPWLTRQLEQDIALAKPENQARLEEARRLVDAGERDKATDVFRRMFNGLTPEGTVGREYYNNLAFNAAGWPEARQGMERLLRETPGDSILALFYGKQLIRHEDSRAEGARVLARLTQRVEIAGDADESWRLALVWIGPPNASQVPLFEEYLKAHPDDQEIRDQMNKGQQKAATTGGSTWQQDPLVASGLRALEKGDQAGAEKAFQARLKARPDDSDALGGLGVVRQQQGRFPEAEQLLTRAISKGGSRWKTALENVRYWALLQQGRDLQAKGQTVKATDAVAQAMRMNPNGLDARLALADIQAQAGQFDSAAANYRQVLASQRGNPQAIRGLVNVLSQTGQADEALSLLDSLPATEQARLGDTGQLRALRSTQMASVAEQRGDIRGAQSALIDAVNSDPDNVWTRFSLARLYLKTGESKKARDLIDSFLQSHPDNVDALYTSALLSVEMEQWSNAQASISRIPANRRSPDMNELAERITLTTQVNLAAAMAKRGQRQEALALLDRLQPMAARSPERTATLASAYVDAGDVEHALSMMRSLLTQSSAPSADLMLQYASLLLKTGDDAQVNTILNSLQNQPLSVATRKRYDDVLYLYRVRQADRLREGGDLAAAYDTLAPALAQRPGDVTATSALARMYTANGDTAKAFDLYKPLLKRNPNDPLVLLNAADAAVLAHDNGYAENALDQFMALQTYDPQSLTEVARIYRAMGQTSKATEVLRKAVAIEQAEKQRSLAAQPGAMNVAANPFADVAGSRRQVLRAPASAIPPPAEAILNGGAMVASAEGVPADAYARQPRRSALTASVPGATVAQANPFNVQPPSQTVLTVVDSTSSAQRALNGILQERSGYITEGLSVRSNNSESGLSKLTDIENPFEVNMPVGDNRVAVRITPVALSAGSVKGEAASRFGGASSATSGIGSQRAEGVGVGVAYERPDEGIKADLGSTPIGFKYATAVGGVSIDRPLDSNANVRYRVAASRRAVTDSLTSFAGTTDKRDGGSWGGVTANGVRGEMSYDNSKVGAYGYGSVHELLGHNVESNTRGELGGGVYWYLDNMQDHSLTVGLSATALGYENNQDFFTYGHGGYFSPQSYFALGVPVTWQQRTERFTYQVKSSVGVQHFQQDGADFFPDDSARQAASGSRYSGQSKTGVGYSLAAAGEYKFGSRFFLGATIGLDNASDYQQFNGGVYARYMFEDMTGSPMALPVSPYRSPYSN